MFTPSFLTKPDAIEAELSEMQQFLELPVAADNYNAMKDRLGSLAQHMARSGKLKADAEYHYSQMYNGAVMGALKMLAEASMSTSTINEFIKNQCGAYKQLITWADRVNRACVHQSDGLRTIISYQKQERQYQ